MGLDKWRKRDRVIHVLSQTVKKPFFIHMFTYEVFGFSDFHISHLAACTSGLEQRLCLASWPINKVKAPFPADALTGTSSRYQGGNVIRYSINIC